MEPADAFVLVKGRHFNGSTYSQDEISVLRSNLDLHLRPVASFVDTADSADTRFRPSAKAAMDCLYPNWMGLYTDDRRRHMAENTFSYWWGAWQIGWEMIFANELESRISYETVLLVRADLDFQMPIAPRDQRDLTLWYTAIEPPDAFWVMPRRVAAGVLTSASRMVSCSGDAGCCALMPGCFSISWVNVCNWADRLGVPVVQDDSCDYTVRTHGNGLRHSLTHYGESISCSPWDVGDYQPWLERENGREECNNAESWPSQWWDADTIFASLGP